MEVGNGSKRTDADKKDGNGPDARVTNHHACSPKSADDNRRTVFGWHSTIAHDGAPGKMHPARGFRRTRPYAMRSAWSRSPPLKIVRHAGIRWACVRMASQSSMLERDENR